MWQVLKAEMAYNSLNFVYVMAVSVTGFLFLHFWPALFAPATTQNVGYMSICYMYFYFVMTMIILPWDKEKRSRNFAVLPLPIRQISYSHLTLFLFFWMEILLLFLVFVFLSAHYFFDSKTGIALLSQTGIIFLLYGCLGLMTVFPDSVWRKTGEVSLFLLFALITVTGIVHSFQGKENVHAVDKVLSWMYQSLYGSLTIVFVGIGVVCFVLFVPWRRSYVDG
jgi:hypothetical protein